MLYRAFLVLVFLVVAIGGGAASIWLVLEKAPLVGSLTSGPWVAFPVAGTPEADPYSRARHVRTGGLALGPSEGIILTASEDSSARTLRSNCTYTIEGIMPSARLWTIYATDAEGNLLPDRGQRRPALHSEMIVRDGDNRFTISVSPHPVPNNWLPVSGTGRLQIVLTLFETPVAAASQLSELVLPTITSVGCDA